MGQNFIADTVNQTLLFPPSLHDWLPEGHLARFLLDVVSALALSAIYTSYQEKDGRGQAAYAPEMMVRLLLYGYANGVYSSRKIEKRTYEDVAFRFLSGDQHPDHSTLGEFRKRHLDALAGLFKQALLLCAEAGLVKLGHVAIDGTKIKANASKHKAMSYKRMNETEARLDREVKALMAAAEKTDAEEDAQYGKDRGGDEQRAAARGCIAKRDDAQQVAKRSWARGVQDAQGDRRAGLWTDQGTTRFSPLQPARQAERLPRVEAGVRGEQSAEAVPCRLGSGNGIKRRGKAPFYPKPH